MPDALLHAEVPSSTMRGDLAASRGEATSGNSGPQRYALSVAVVVDVDYETMRVTLRTETGNKEQRVPVPMTFPGAGGRHFFGALPMPGDVCVVGWGPQESGLSRTPWILAWIIPGVSPGYDWLITQGYAPDESGTPPYLREQLSGAMDRVRHKLRHMEPGNIVASSAQGADLVLNESALLTNRRGNEVHLRDQDQAIIFRSLQQFHAGAGFRVYSGMVQRDATFLPSQMFSDGTAWDSARQVDAEGAYLDASELDASDYASGFLTPASVFRKSDSGDAEGDRYFNTELDPFTFLQQGMFIDEDGFASGTVTSDSIYGGKPIYRVSTLGDNATPNPNADTLTEFRIEVAHTSDGTLPVTEQTDGFDADRLPSGQPGDVDPLGGSTNASFMDFVLGSVVGNDPFTVAGRAVYGVPLRPVVFDGDVRSPAMQSGLGASLSSHASFLLQIRPPVGPPTAPSWVSLTKDGRMFASIAGPGSTWSAEMALQSGLRLGSGVGVDGQSILADLDGALVVRSKVGRNTDNIGMLFQADQGAIKLFAAGASQEGGPSARNTGGDGNLPALILESGGNTLIKAVGTLTLSANVLNLENIAGIRIAANSGLDFKSADGISNSSNTYMQSSTGKSTFNYSGPKNGLPTNGALREVSFTGNPATGFVGGTADSYSLLYGDRTETLTAGNHTTAVVVGNQTYSVGAGTVTMQSGPSALALTSASMSGTAPSMAFVATAGGLSLTSSASIVAGAPTMTLAGNAITLTSLTPGIHTPPGGTPGGALMTDGVLDPITGRTFFLSGIIGVQSIRVV